MKNDQFENLNFPDKQFLMELLEHLKGKIDKWNKLPDQFLMVSGASMNWIADFVTDSTVKWEKRELPVMDLVLTGTRPEWNKIIIDQAQRSPQKLKQLMSEESIKTIFDIAQVDPRPILVRYDEGQYKILDGMTRVIAAIRDDVDKVWAFVATTSNSPKPQCEPHMVYDLLKAYHRKLNTDRSSLIIALKYLRRAYSNVDDLLKNRFSKSWVPNNDIQEIIKEALVD